MLFNGRVLLLGRRAIETGPNGVLKLSGAFFETDYADFLAWEEFGDVEEPVSNCFSMAAIRGDDGAFLLGEMAQHTVNAGQIYFPAGTPDPSDVFDDKVDLEASARRELLEETGVDAAEAQRRARLDSGAHAPAHRLHEADDAGRLRHSAQDADRRLSGERSSRRAFTHAYRARPARHRRNAGADLCRRLPAQRVCSEAGRVTAPPLSSRRSSTWPQRRGRLCAARYGNERSARSQAGGPLSR